MKINLLRYFALIGFLTIFIACSDDSSNSTIALTNIKLSNAEAVNGVEKILTIKFIPEDATNQNVAWTSSNTAVATINNGKVLALVNDGTTTITATSEDGGHVATCTITAVPRCNGINSTNQERCKNKGSIVDTKGNVYCKTHENQVK